MNKTCFTLLSIFVSMSIFTINTQAQDSLPIDSIRLEEITVTGTMTAVNIRNLPMSISVVNSKQLKNRYEPSILPTLTEEVPGLFVTNRGIMGYSVSGGSAGGMSMRGIGGSPTAGLLVLIDGHPQYMGMMGHPLADAYSSTIAERVEVVRGPASILYGSNAMGGVINIITPKQTQDQVRTHARIMYGSYNTVTSEVNNSVRAGKWNTHTSLSYNRTDGHRDNMRFDQQSGYAKVGYTFSPHWNSFADVNFIHFDAENPGAVTTPITDGLAKVNRGMTSLALINQYEQTSGAFKLFYNFGEHKINDGYNATNQTPKTFRFHSHDKMLGASLYQSYQLFEGNQTTTGIDYQHFGGWARNDSLNGKQKELVDKGINDLAGYINMQQQLSSYFTLNGGVRYDYNSHTGGEWIPQVGISYLPSNQTVLKAIVSKGFRNPTIREMYMFPPQNPTLKPERLMNYELSAVRYLLNQQLRAELNLYYINGDNLIQVVKQPNGQMLNINTGEVENYGLEASVRYQANARLSLSSNYSYLHMKHAVVAAPEHKLYVGATYNRTKWNLATGMQYIHNLYTQIKPNAITENYAMWNMRAAYRPSKIVEFFVKGENLLNQTYSINAGFPMPGATCFGGINLTL